MIQRTLLSLSLLAGVIGTGAAVAAPLPASPAVLVGEGLLVLTEGWHERSERSVLTEDGGSIDWTALQTADDGWQGSPPTDEQRQVDGVHWYRTEIRIEPAAAAAPLGVFLELEGSAQLFVDGRLTNAFGRLEPVEDGRGVRPAELAFGRREQPLPPLEAGRHELLVRYRSENGSFGWMTPLQGFRLALGDREAVSQRAQRATRAGTRFQWLFVGAFLAQSILHLMIFLFLPRFPSNVWFSLNAVLSALLAGLHFESSLTDDPASLVRVTTFWNPILFVTMIVLLAVIYEVYDRRRGRVFWALTTLAAGLAFYVVAVPGGDAFSRFWWVQALILAEALRVNVAAIRSGWRGAVLIGAGLVLLSASLLWQILLVAGVVRQPFELFPVAYSGVALFLFSVSAYLARKFAQAGQTLRERREEIDRLSSEKVERELEARLLEADNARKTDELERARTLQLSLLPREVPRVVGLDIAVSMSTATEVGGDYYDFRERADGSLLVAIGDAAGHGAGAGNLVAMMKGLFSTFDGERPLPQFFEEANRAVCAMELPAANTAMALARLTPDGLTWAAAGIPPALVVRAATGAVDELLVEGTPLGAFAGFRYRETTTTLESGDLVLLMSDGLAELPDPDGELFGYERLAELVGAVAGEGADEVIRRLRDAARQWSGGAPYPDDLTLVAVKVGAG